MRSAFGFRKSEDDEEEEEQVGLTADLNNSPRRELKRPILTTAKQSEMDQLEGMPPGAKDFVAALLQHRDRLVPRGMVQAMMFGPGPLGLFIVDVGPLVLVAAFESSNSNNSNPAGQAEVLGQITPGDQIVSVNGRKCYGLGVNKVCRMMAVAKRPVFIEYRKMVISTGETMTSQELCCDDPSITSSTTTTTSGIASTTHRKKDSATPGIDTAGNSMRIDMFTNASAPGGEENVSVAGQQTKQSTKIAGLRNCDSCQTKLSRSNAKFCSNCGARLV